MNKVKILLDMDGVLVDFIGRFLELQFPFDYGYVKDEFLSGKSFPLDDGLDPYVVPPRGTSLEDWKAAVIDKLTAYVWATMDRLPWAYPLLDMLKNRFGAESIWLCTSAGMPETKWYMHSLSGKAGWIHQHVPWLGNRLIVTSQKEKLLEWSKDCVLIDDRWMVVEPFVAAGGRAVLCPQWWNKYWEHLIVDGKIGWYNEKCVEPVLRVIEKQLDEIT